MDPEETLRLMVEAAQAGDYKNLTGYAYALRDWLRRGGYAPRGTRLPAPVPAELPTCTCDNERDRNCDVHGDGADARFAGEGVDDDTAF